MSCLNKNYAGVVAATAAGVTVGGLLLQWASRKCVWGKWFSEMGSMWPGQCLSLKIKEIKHKSRSDYQDVMVFESTNHGTVLSLDGVIQLTTFDEFAYQEMLAHLPIMSHKNPKRVLVIGGGDGGVIREVCRHPQIEVIDLCELDAEVLRVSRQHLPTVSTKLDGSDGRVRIYIEDGVEYLANLRQKGENNKYDIIIVDSSDPVGPADVLFRQPFYQLMFDSLNEGGIAATQGECMWIHRDTIKEVISFSKKIGFPSVEYSHLSIPTYPCGTIGVLCCSKESSCKIPLRSMDAKTEAQLRYYTPALHSASFVLPRFVQLDLDTL